MANMDDLLKQEVRELTGLLRSDPDWQDLRAAILGQGLRLDEILLAGFFEDEAESEFGAVVTAEGLVFSFERSSAVDSAGFRRWQQIEEVEELLNTFPAVGHALQMTSEGLP